MIPLELTSVNQWVLWKELHGQKVPFMSATVAASSTDSATWLSHAQAEMRVKRGGFAGLGFVFTAEDNFLGIDLDDCVEDGVIQTWAKEIIDECQSYAEISPSGTGVKIFGTGIPESASGSKDGQVECYSQGRYFTVTGDAVNDYPLADITEVYNRLHNGQSDTTVAQVEMDAVENWEARAQGLVDSHPQAISGKSGHDTTFKLAVKLVKGLALGFDDAMRFMRQYNETKCQPPWKESELIHKVRSAMKADRVPVGFLDEEEWEVDLPVDLPTPQEVEIAVTRAEIRESHLQQPANLFDFDGTLKELHQYILRSSALPDAGAALVTSVVVMGTLMGRKRKTDGNISPNLYAMIIGDSGSGKNQNVDPVRRLKEYLPFLGKYLASEMGSAQGLCRSLAESPARVYMVDEIHGLLQQMANRLSHRSELASLILRLWSACDDSEFVGQEYADKNKTHVVAHPHFSLLGMTTPKNFFESLTANAAEDGTLGRFLLYSIENPYRDFQQPDLSPPSARLIEDLEYWTSTFHDADGNDLYVLKPDTQIVKCEEDARGRLWKYATDIRKRLGDDSEAAKTVWVRAPEKAEKLALIRACSRQPRLNVITLADVQWAIDLVTWLTHITVSQLRAHHAETQTEAWVKRFFNYIKESKSEGRTKSELALKFQSVKRPQRQEYLETLMEQRVVTFRMKGSGKRGRNSQHFYAVEFAPPEDEGEE